VVNNQNFPSFDLFPRSQTGTLIIVVLSLFVRPCANERNGHQLIVAYNYYLGRLSIFEEQYQKVCHYR
jgi:hypothetical protein